jgi:hypothetical protein
MFRPTVLRTKREYDTIGAYHELNFMFPNRLEIRKAQDEDSPQRAQSGRCKEFGQQCLIFLSFRCAFLRFGLR